MKVVEFRIALPLGMDEFHRCLLYMVTKASIHEMENGSGIEIFKNEPYERDGIIGRFTDKRFHLAKNLPSWLQSILGQDLTVLSEQSWNTFPYTLTKYSNKKLTTFEFSVETKSIDNLETLDNALDLNSKDLSRRKIVNIDLTEFSKSKLYDASIDVTLSQSELTDILPLKPGWMKEPGRAGVISYKVVKLDIPYFGFLASKIENFVVSFIQDKLMVHLSSALCSIDEWYNSDIELLLAKESECYVLLNQKFREAYGHLVTQTEAPLPTEPETKEEAPPVEAMNSDPIFIPPIEKVVEVADDSDIFCDCLEELDDIDDYMFDVNSACASCPPTPLDNVSVVSDPPDITDVSQSTSDDMQEDIEYESPTEATKSGSVEKLPLEQLPITRSSSPISVSSGAKDDGKYTPSVFTGYLYKLGGTFFYQWNIRYIVISSGTLYYFDSRENTRPKAAISLSDARVNWVGEYMNRSYVFSVTTKSKRTSYWSADQEPSVKRWILLLQVLCENSPDTLIENLAAGYLYRLSSPDSEDAVPAATNMIHGL